jgi:hypothetical protein
MTPQTTYKRAVYQKGFSVTDLPCEHIAFMLRSTDMLILGNDKLDALFLSLFIYASTCFEQQVLIIRSAQLY